MKVRARFSIYIIYYKTGHSLAYLRPMKQIVVTLASIFTDHPHPKYNKPPHDLTNQLRCFYVHKENILANGTMSRVPSKKEIIDKLWSR